MESLYRKYRPQTFEQVVGQKHVVNTLERAVQEGRVSHAYLFCGPRGTGKTTMARLLSKALVCERGAGQLPDGTCEQCRAIAAGEHPDVYELDAASRTGVDAVREEIINRVDFAPAIGRSKVYIVDEVHMLTTQAFNALLKTLEEPPAHVVFVLCTTDPQKVPATILSRVQRFDFHSIGNDEIRDHLADVCRQEGFTADPAALELVARHARGGMRDALSTLEQLSVFGDGDISLEAARDLLGEGSDSELDGLMAALAGRDVATLFSEVADQVALGRDLQQYTAGIVSRVRDLYVLSVAGSRPGVVSATGAELAALQREAATFGTSDRLARVLSTLGDTLSAMRFSTNQRLLLEVAFTKLARPDGELTLEDVTERLAALEAKLAGLPSPTAVPAASAQAFAVAPQPVSVAAKVEKVEAVASAAPVEARTAEPAALEAPAAKVADKPAPAQGEPAAVEAAAGVAAEVQESAQTVQSREAPLQPSDKPAGPAVEAAPVSQKAAAGQVDLKPAQVDAGAQASQAAGVPAAQAQRQSQQSQPQAASQPAPAAAPAQAQRPSQPQAPARPASQPQAPQTAGVSAAQAQRQSQQPSQAQPAPAQAPRPSQQPASAPSGQLKERWAAVIAHLQATSPSTCALVKNAVPASDNGSELRLALPQSSGFLVKMLARPDVKSALDAAVAEVFGPRAVAIGDDAIASPASGHRTVPASQPASAAQPKPQARPASPQAQPTSQPKPQAQPAAQPKPQPQAQPAPAPQQQAQPERPRRPLPWEEGNGAPAQPAPQQPAPTHAAKQPMAPQRSAAPTQPAPQPAPAFDDVPPYDDMPPYDDVPMDAYGDVPPLDDYGFGSPAPQPAMQPRQGAGFVPQQAPQQPAPRPAAPAPQPKPAPSISSSAHEAPWAKVLAASESDAPLPVPTPDPEPAPAPDPAKAGDPEEPIVAPPGLTDDEADVFDLMSSVFGAGVQLLPMEEDSPRLDS